MLLYTYFWKSGLRETRANGKR